MTVVHLAELIRQRLRSIQSGSQVILCSPLNEMRHREIWFPQQF
jgi:hypothetical protein